MEGVLSSIHERLNSSPLVWLHHYVCNKASLLRLSLNCSITLLEDTCVVLHDHLLAACFKSWKNICGLVTTLRECQNEKVQGWAAANQELPLTQSDKNDMQACITAIQHTLSKIGKLESMIQALPSIDKVLECFCSIPDIFLEDRVVSSVVQCLLMLTVKVPSTTIGKKSNVWVWHQMSKLLKLSDFEKNSGFSNRKNITDTSNAARSLGFRDGDVMKEALNTTKLFASSADTTVVAQPQAGILLSRVSRHVGVLLSTPFADEIVQSILPWADLFPCNAPLQKELLLQLYNSQSRLSDRSCILVQEHSPQLFQTDVIRWCTATLKSISHESELDTLQNLIVNCRREIATSVLFAFCVKSPKLALLAATALKLLVQSGRSTTQSNTLLFACFADCFLSLLVERAAKLGQSSILGKVEESLR